MVRERRPDDWMTENTDINEMHRPPDTASFNHHINFFFFFYYYAEMVLIPDIFLSVLCKHIQVKHQNIGSFLISQQENLNVFLMCASLMSYTFLLFCYLFVLS